MWFVYSLHIKSGKQDCVNKIFNTAQDAVNHIAKCYDIDRGLRQLGEYYYFMRQR